MATSSRALFDPKAIYANKFRRPGFLVLLDAVLVLTFFLGGSSAIASSEIYNTYLSFMHTPDISLPNPLQSFLACYVIALVDVSLTVVWVFLLIFSEKAEMNSLANAAVTLLAKRERMASVMSSADDAVERALEGKSNEQEGAIVDDDNDSVYSEVCDPNYSQMHSNSPSPPKRKSLAVNSLKSETVVTESPNSTSNQSLSQEENDEDEGCFASESTSKSRSSMFSHPLEFATSQPAVVMDIGSHSSKFGFSSALKPDGIIPSLVCSNYPGDSGSSDRFLSRRRSKGGLKGTGSKPIVNGDYIGLSAQKRAAQLELIGSSSADGASIGIDLSSPVEGGVMRDWDAMEKLWEYIYEHELSADSAQHGLLLSWSPSETKESAERAVEILFEKFGVPGIYMGVSPVLSLYGVGKTTGCVLDSGHGLTHACTIYEGFALPTGCVSSRLAGLSVTRHLIHLLSLKGHIDYKKTKDSFAHIDQLGNIKESVCYCAKDYEKELSEVVGKESSSAVLPDGTQIYIEKERIQVSELLFRPTLLPWLPPSNDPESFNMGLPDCVKKAIDSCPQEEVRNLMWGNVVISGGNSNFSFFPERLKNELSKLSKEAQVHAPSSRELSVWLGGSVLASMGESFAGNWITRAEFEEMGAMVVHSKCQTSIVNN